MGTECQGILCLTFHSISICTHCSKKSKWWQKIFVDDRSSIDSLIYMKRRGSLSVLFWTYSEKKVLWKPSNIQTSTWILENGFWTSALAWNLLVIFIQHCSSKNFGRHTFLWMEWKFQSKLLKILICGGMNGLAEVGYNLEINFI